MRRSRMVALFAGCGDDSKDTTTAKQKEPIPASLPTIESASEDIIDLALAGKRAEVVQKAKRLDAAAQGEQSDALKTRAARVAKLAPSAPLLDVAVASNQAFALVPDLFARYDTPVPASVTRLDYSRLEIKLESKGGRHREASSSSCRPPDDLGFISRRCAGRARHRALRRAT